MSASNEKAIIELMKNRVLKLRCASCPERYPYNDKLELHQQQHPEFRKGSVSICNAVLDFITRIEQELDVQPSMSPLSTRRKLQTAPVHQCCKASDDLQNQEGL